MKRESENSFLDSCEFAANMEFACHSMGAHSKQETPMLLKFESIFLCLLNALFGVALGAINLGRNGTLQDVS